MCSRSGMSRNISIIISLGCILWATPLSKQHMERNRMRWIRTVIQYQMIEQRWMGWRRRNKEGKKEIVLCGRYTYRVCIAGISEDSKIEKNYWRSYIYIYILDRTVHLLSLLTQDESHVYIITVLFVCQVLRGVII
mmetsp:Transcript_28792/g.42422  ORF Transcript_28792/g.42422 Transcript_28792/m.42422 type:complete len:136 (-) Transcript_28792:113-520(-)